MAHYKDSLVPPPRLPSTKSSWLLTQTLAYSTAAEVAGGDQLLGVNGYNVTFQTCTVLSLLAEAICCQSDDHLTALTEPIGTLPVVSPDVMCPV